MTKRGWRATVGYACLLAASVIIPSAAQAGQKLAIFPIDMTIPRSEEDFFRGVSGPNEAEKKRLVLAQDDLAKRIAADGRYEIVDLAPIAADVDAARPIHECNGCELALGAKANADLVMTSVIDKISETHLSLNVAIIDVQAKRLVRTGSVLIQGNTDESWLHGVRWVTKNRLLAEENPK